MLAKMRHLEGFQPDAYDPNLDVDFTGCPAYPSVAGFGRAA